jgi:hypothetical protein
MMPGIPAHGGHHEQETCFCRHDRGCRRRRPGDRADRHSVAAAVRRDPAKHAVSLAGSQTTGSQGAMSGSGSQMNSPAGSSTTSGNTVRTPARPRPWGRALRRPAQISTARTPRARRAPATSARRASGADGPTVRCGLGEHRSAATALVLIGFVAALTGAAAKLDRGDPVETALRTELLRLEEGDGFISDAYAARAFKPMWTPTEAREVIGWLERANDEGLPVHRYHVAALRRALLLADRSPRDRARFEIVMSRALASYGSDLRRPAARVKVFVSDRSVAPPSRSAVLMAAARAPPWRNTWQGRAR